MTKRLLLLLVAGLCASAFTLASAKGPVTPVPLAKAQRATEGHWVAGLGARKPVLVPPAQARGPVVKSLNAVPLPVPPGVAKVPREHTATKLKGKPPTDDGYILQNASYYFYGDVSYPSYTMGWYFTPQVNGTITQLGYYDPYYSGYSGYVELWDVSTQAEIANAWVYPNYGWGYTSINAVSVSAGHQYAVTVSQASYQGYGYNPTIPQVVNDVSMGDGCIGFGVDTYPNNDYGNMYYGFADIYFAAAHYNYNLSCKGIPTAWGDTGTYTPTATIHNGGDQNVSSFAARFYATGPGATYDNTVSGLHLRSGADTVVSFPSWHITVEGSWAMSCSTRLSSDEWPNDDKFATTVSIPTIYTNVLSQVSGSSIYYGGSWNGANGGYYFTPDKNGVISALGRYRGSYEGDVSSVSLWRVSDASLLAQVDVSDSGWIAAAITPVTVIAGTQYCVSTYGGNDWFYDYPPTVPYVQNDISIDYGAYDYNGVSDMPQYNEGTWILGAPDIYFTVVTHAHDITCTGIPSPQGDTGTYTPSATFHNWGTTNAPSFSAHFLATGPGATYDNTVSGLHMASGTDTTVLFPSWHITAQGAWTMACSAALSGDEDNTNDKYTVVRYINNSWKVLVVAAEDMNSYPILLNAIRDSSLGQISSADWFDPRNQNLPSPAGLLANRYKAILTFGDYGYSDATAMGDSLAKYMELGGGVVITPFGDEMIAGRYSTQYMPIPVTGDAYGSMSLGTVHDPSHPIMNGVSSVTSGEYNCGATTIAHPTYTDRIADWNTGNVECAAYDSLGVRTVSLGYFPVQEIGHYLSGNWIRELDNALLWVPYSPPTPVHDVGATRVTAPSGTLDSGSTVTPACSVYNYGNQVETYTVRMQIGSAYDNTATVTAHNPHVRLYVTFPTWTALQRGVLATACSTQLSGDATPANDKATGSVTVRVQDVGCEAIVAPTGLISLGTVVTPACSVSNWGTITQSYAVRMRIGSSYNQTAQITSQPAGTTVYATFPTWTATPAGTYAVSCSTMLSSDVKHSDDKLTGSVIVGSPLHDVGATRIVVPGAPLDSGATVTPACTVYNYGNQTETFNVRMKIGGAYDNTATITGLVAGAHAYTTFADWTALTRGSVAVKCSTELTPKDTNPANDKVAGTVFVNVHDIGVAAIVAPLGIVAPGNITPQARVHNYGTIRDACAVTFLIPDATPPYSQITLLPGGLPLADTLLSFPAWPGTVGTYTAKCSTYMATDVAPANDVKTAPFQVALLASGWGQMASVPPGAKSKNVKDGGSLAVLPTQSPSFDDTDIVYALKGNGRYEFYAYNTVTNTWTTPESIPAIGSSGKKKAVKKGASMAPLNSSGTRAVFATKGGGTVEFWAYDPSANKWGARPDVPIGGKAIKEGSGMATVNVSPTTSYIYLLKGSGTQEFYRFNTATNVWELKAPAPTGLSGKPFKDGSCIAASEDGSTIFAVKANYNEFYSYSVDSDKWTTLTPLPLVGTSGKKKKLKSGAAMADHNDIVYVTKGNNTTEFWSYVADSNKWAQLVDFPLGSGKKVKGGGAMAYAPNAHALFMLQGNNTLNFYKYGLSADLGSDLGAGNANVQSSSDLGVRNTELRIAPNPFSNATTISYSLPKSGNVSLKLYDVTGKLVTTLATGYRNAGTSSFTVSRSTLASGIYLLKLESDNTTTTSKLIIQ